MTLEELRAAIRQKLDGMEKLLADHPDGLDEEQENTFTRLEAEHAKLKAQLDRRLKLERERADTTEGGGRQTRATTVPAKPKNHEVEDNFGFENLADFAMATRSFYMNEGLDDRLKFFNAAPDNPMKESGSSDGILVPPGQSSSLYELMFNEPDLMGMVEEEPTNSNSVPILADESTPWGSTGIQAYWGAEAGKLKKSRLETEGKDVKLHKLHAMVDVTDELLEDVPRLNERLSRGAARAMNWVGNGAIMNGSGVGKPLGFSVAGSKIAVPKEDGQAATTLVAENVANMYARCINPSQASWFCNQDVLPKLMMMTIGNQPIWTAPSQGFVNAPGGFLLGRPVLFSDQCETVGDEGDIQLINPKGYYSPRKRSGVKFSMSMHLYFDHDSAAFKWTFRLGGQPFLNKAIVPNKGSNTRSHYVRLASRH